MHRADFLTALVYSGQKPRDYISVEDDRFTPRPFPAKRQICGY